MCGIAGIINHGGVSTEKLYHMSKVLKHRGPDDEGFCLLSHSQPSKYFKGDDTISELSQVPHIIDSSNVKSYEIGLVHRRLSILDLSPSGHQPMAYADRFDIIFNGEIYNYKELKQDLNSKGFHFTTDTDTEVILAAYYHWGEDCVNHFIGMWAFAIYDKIEKLLFLSRDRFGIKPLYFFQNKTLFAFASEIKALLTLDEIKPEGDFNSILEYISFGATSNPSTNLFKNIQTLKPSHNLLLDTSALKFDVKPYYRLNDQVEHYSFSSNKEIQESFSKILWSSIDLHLRADVPIGSTLSGGLDSSTIVAMASLKMEGKSFKTFTAAYTEKEIDESYFAKKVISDHQNIDAYFSYPDIKTYWADFDKLIWHQDLPINSTSMFAQWEVMKLANQQNIKVLLDGQGADEILGGYYNFAGIYLIEKLKRLQIPSFMRERAQLQQNFSPNINQSIAKSMYYFLPEFLQKYLRSKKRIGMGFVSDSYRHQLSNIDVPARGGKSFKEQSLLSIEFGLQDLLRYEDRNSMAFSIESRVPFLDHRLVEFSVALNNDWKINNGWTKYILRKTAEPILNKEIVWRKYKMGFLTPQKLWKLKSKNELSQFINDTKIPDFLNREYLIKLNDSDINDTSHLSEFWKLISFLKWLDIFKVSL
ncbi:MAG: asparagine synthase (glutamine-hydrolyzing) [Bacteroidota bacterium]